MSRSNWLKKKRAAQPTIRANKPVPEFFIGSGGAAKFTAAPESEGGVKLKRFEGKAYTGAPMKPEGWPTPIIVDLDGVRFPESQNRLSLRHVLADLVDNLIDMLRQLVNA
jgi:hypothetical protein